MKDIQLTNYIIQMINWASTERYFVNSSDMLFGLKRVCNRLLDLARQELKGIDTRAAAYSGEGEGSRAHPCTVRSVICVCTHAADSPDCQSDCGQARM